MHIYLFSSQIYKALYSIFLSDVFFSKHSLLQLMWKPHVLLDQEIYMFVCIWDIWNIWFLNRRCFSSGATKEQKKRGKSYLFMSHYKSKLLAPLNILEHYIFQLSKLNLQGKCIWWKHFLILLYWYCCHFKNRSSS